MKSSNPFSLDQSHEIDTFHTQGVVLFNMDNVKEFLISRKMINIKDDIVSWEWLATDNGFNVARQLTQFKSTINSPVIHQMKGKKGVVFGNKIACLCYIHSLMGQDNISNIGRLLTIENLLDQNTNIVSSPYDIKIEVAPNILANDDNSVMTDTNIPLHSRQNLFEALRHTTRYMNQVIYRNIASLVPDTQIISFAGEFLSRIHNILYRAILKNDHEVLMHALLKECGNPYSSKSGAPRDYFTIAVDELFVIAEMEAARFFSSQEPFSTIEDFNKSYEIISSKLHGKNFFKKLVSTSESNVLIMQKKHKSVVSQVLITPKGQLISRMVEPNIF